MADRKKGYVRIDPNSGEKVKGHWLNPFETTTGQVIAAFVTPVLAYFGWQFTKTPEKPPSVFRTPQGKVGLGVAGAAVGIAGLVVATRLCKAESGEPPPEPPP